MAEKKKCLATVKSQSELAPGIYSLWLAFPEEYNVAAMAKPGQFCRCIAMMAADCSQDRSVYARLTRLSA